MPRAASWFRRLFRCELPLIGVIHLPPLPGAPRATLEVERIVAAAVRDARAYLGAGLDGLLVENFGDAPFPKDESPPHVIAVMTRVAAEVKGLARGAPVGANVLRNDALGALAVSCGAGLDFIRVNVLCGARVTDQGIIEGRADRLLRRRREIGATVRILADFRVKHARSLGGEPESPESAAIEVEELVGRAGADALLVTGPTTGRPPAAGDLGRVKRAARTAPVLAASGVDLDCLAALAPVADGFIVGSSLKRKGDPGEPVDPARARALARALARLAGRRPVA